MVKLEKIKPGDRLLDIHREKMGNTTVSQWGLWYVLVVEVDVPGNRALVRWNEANRPQWWSRRRVEKLYTKPTKAYREQEERKKHLAEQRRSK